ncbi:MAG: tRNA-dihydrouridine synthase, partial [Shimia sp.]
RGRPWALLDVMDHLNARAPRVVREPPNILSVATEHYEAMLRFYGTVHGGRVARKHLGWYMDGAGTPASLRRAILTSDDPKAVRARLVEALAPREVAA